MTFEEAKAKALREQEKIVSEVKRRPLRYFSDADRAHTSDEECQDRKNYSLHCRMYGIALAGKCRSLDELRKAWNDHSLKFGKARQDGKAWCAATKVTEVLGGMYFDVSQDMGA